MEESRPFSTLLNKCELIGRIISEPTLRYDERSDQQILAFTLAVSREGLPMSWNKDDYNYFVCRLTERLVGGENIVSAQNTLHYGMIIKVDGILESKPYTDRHIKARSIIVRACQAFNHYILVVGWADGRQYIEDIEKLKAETRALREVFGTDADINWRLEQDEGGKSNGTTEIGGFAELPDF